MHFFSHIIVKIFIRKNKHICILSMFKMPYLSLNAIRYRYPPHLWYLAGQEVGLEEALLIVTPLLVPDVFILNNLKHKSEIFILNNLKHKNIYIVLFNMLSEICTDMLKKIASFLFGRELLYMRLYLFVFLSVCLSFYSLLFLLIAQLP